MGLLTSFRRSPRQATGAIVGIDVRDMPSEAATSLPDLLREAGFDIEAGSEPHRRHPDVVITWLRCRRGDDSQGISWMSALSPPGHIRVYIGNATGWRRSVHERRSRLQADVTAIIERNGGYWPFPE